MKQSDLQFIPTKGIDKKWWQSHRSRKAKASGVGKALDTWNAAGMPPKGKVVNLENADNFEAAFAACVGLEKALKTALGKVKGKAKDTEDGVNV